MRRRFEEMHQSAKTTAKWDLDTDAGYEKFRFFALEQGIREENLAYYVNAYQANGEPGLKALVYKKPMPEEVRIEATRIMMANGICTGNAHPASGGLMSLPAKSTPLTTA